MEYNKHMLKDQEILDELTVLQNIEKHDLSAEVQQVEGFDPSIGDAVNGNSTTDVAVGSQHIGRVDYVEGTVYIYRSGQIIEAKEGDSIYQNDSVITQEDGAANLTFIDESQFSMGSSGRMVINEMIFDPQAQQGSMSIFMSDGAFNFVSGMIAKTDPDAMMLDTPVATIGIRGTEGLVDLSNNGFKVVLLQEEGGFVGEIIVTSNGKTFVLNRENEFTQIIDNQLQEPVILEPDQIIDEFGDIVELVDDEETVLDEEIAGLDDFQTDAGGDPGFDNDFTNVTGDYNEDDNDDPNSDYPNNNTNTSVDNTGGADDDVSTDDTGQVYVPDEEEPNDNVSGDSETGSGGEQNDAGGSGPVVPAGGEDGNEENDEDDNGSGSLPGDPQDPEPEPVYEVSREVTYNTTTSTVVSDPVTSTTYEDVATTENDLDANEEIVTTTRYYTDETVTTTTTTTTTVLTETITYSDGTVEVINSDPEVNTEETVDTSTSERSDVISVAAEQPDIQTTYETETSTETLDPILVNTTSDVINNEYPDKDNNREVKETTTTTNETYQIETITTTTQTPIYTITYSDGTVEIESGEPNTTTLSSLEMTTTTNETVSYEYSDPIITVTYETNTDTIVGDPELVNTESATNVEEYEDDENERDVVETTITTTKTYEIETTATTTETPVYTITYSDGTTETEYGETTSSTSSSIETTTEVDEQVSYEYEEWPEDDNNGKAWGHDKNNPDFPGNGSDENNGWGNGDQDAPGNSLEHNNAENNMFIFDGINNWVEASPEINFDVISGSIEQVWADTVENITVVGNKDGNERGNNDFELEDVESYQSFDSGMDDIKDYTTEW